MARTPDLSGPRDPARPSVPVLALMVIALSASAALAGGTLAIWRGFPPQGLDASANVQMQQGAIRGLNLLFPLLGTVAILSTGALAVLARGRRRGLLVAAVGLTVLAGLVTRLGNQPINAVVIGWTPEAPPADWQALRDRWWGLHLLRTAVMASAYVVLTLGCLVPSSAREPALGA